MLKKLGIPILALAALLAFAAPTPAQAKVRFGFSIGPAYPVSPYVYAYPYGYPHYYAYGPYYPYAYPYAYGYPYGYYSGGFYWGGHRGLDRHARVEHHFRGSERGFRGGHVSHGHEGGHRR